MDDGFEEKDMRIGIVGAGAIGGLMGARLAAAGEDVTLIARGPHLEAIRKNGLKLVMDDDDVCHPRWIKATDSIADAGCQDIVILALKAHQIAPVAPDLPSLFGPETVVVPVQNGIPWWYFQRHGGEFEGRRFHSLDPEGVIEANVEAERIIGCIAYPAAEIASPGVIRHIEGNRFPVGELDGAETARVNMLWQVLTLAGFESRILTDIRAEIWLKAWGNLTFNPVSALTRAMLNEICQFALTRELAQNMMLEAQAVAHKLGITFRHTIEKRINGAEKVGAHKTSMLQDLESGRELETEALIGAVIELGKLTGTPTPYIKAVYACITLLAQTAPKRAVA
ncbi:MAG: 2-dehydropantoate 2-reductase [Rhodospirillales bacterium]